MPRYHDMDTTAQRLVGWTVGPLHLALAIPKGTREADVDHSCYKEPTNDLMICVQLVAISQMMNSKAQNEPKRNDLQLIRQQCFVNRAASHWWKLQATPTPTSASLPGPPNQPAGDLRPRACVHACAVERVGEFIRRLNWQQMSNRYWLMITWSYLITTYRHGYYWWIMLLIVDYCLSLLNSSIQ